MERIVSRYAILVLACVGAIWSSPLLAQSTSFCSALRAASGADNGSYPDAVSIGEESIACVFEKANEAWSCTVKATDKCVPQSEADRDETPPGSTPPRLGSDISDAYDKTLKEVMACMPTVALKFLDYRKMVSAADMFASRGAKIQSDDPRKFIYVMQRVHAFNKDKDVCLKGDTKLEVEPDESFNPFLPDAPR